MPRSYSQPLKIGKYCASESHSPLHNYFPFSFQARRGEYYIGNEVLLGSLKSANAAIAGAYGERLEFGYILVFLGTVVIQKHLFQPGSGRPRTRCKIELWNVSALRTTSGICKLELEEQCCTGNSGS